MAVTIRNQTTERHIREIGEQTGEGPSALIARLVGEERKRLNGETEEDRIARRRRAMDEWIASLPPISDEDRREMDRFMAEMYDENGLPK